MPTITLEQVLREFHPMTTEEARRVLHGYFELHRISIPAFSDVEDASNSCPVAMYLSKRLGRRVLVIENTEQVEGADYRAECVDPADPDGMVYDEEYLPESLEAIARRYDRGSTEWTR